MSSRVAHETDVLFQARLSLFAFVMSILLTIAIVVFTVLHAVSPLPRAMAWQLWWLPQGACESMLVGTWIYCRGAPRPRRVLLLLDCVIPVAVATVDFILLYSVPITLRPELTLLIVLTHVLVARAALVPSTPRRTAAVGALSSLPLLGGTYHLYARSPDAPAAITPELALAVILVWSTIAVLSTSVTSRVIYGLQREVRAAKTLGQYTLDVPIGEGGMGVVYRARHVLLRRPTAIKLLSPGRTVEADVRRFEREVRLTSQLTHPNAIAIYDYGRTAEGSFYYAMEYLEGVDLEWIVHAHGPQPAARVIRLLRQVAGALAEAHAIGLVHRDLKPTNVLLCERGGVADVVKVLDFGLVRSTDPTDDSLTVGGSPAGTPLFAPPEAISSLDEIDARGDLYAAGALGYFLLTACAPFEGRTPAEVRDQHARSPSISPSKRLGRPIPPDLEALLLSCLAKDPEQRPASAGALEEALCACADADGWNESVAAEWWASNRDAIRRARADGQATASKRVRRAARIAPRSRGEEGSRAVSHA